MLKSSYINCNHKSDNVFLIKEKLINKYISFLKQLSNKNYCLKFQITRYFDTLRFIFTKEQHVIYQLFHNNNEDAELSQVLTDILTSAVGSNVRVANQNSTN